MPNQILWSAVARPRNIESAADLWSRWLHVSGGSTLKGPGQHRHRLEGSTTPFGACWFPCRRPSRSFHLAVVAHMHHYRFGYITCAHFAGGDVQFRQLSSTPGALIHG